MENTIQAPINSKYDFFSTAKVLAEAGATSVWCAISDELNEMGGVYFEDCNIAEAVPADSVKANGVRPWAINPDCAKKLWQLSEKLTGVKFAL